jgi:hypothetical protein
MEAGFVAAIRLQQNRSEPVLIAPVWFADMTKAGI